MTREPAGVLAPSIPVDTLATDDEWVTRVLAEHHESRALVEQLTVRRLSPGLKALIWGLRIYVGFMAVVVIVNVIQTLH